MRQVGLDADAVFEHPQIVVWRKLADRENCTLDAELADGSRVRLHVKRYAAPRRRRALPSEAEVRGIELLRSAGIATVPLVGWGGLADGRSFVITEDLADYQASDKLIERRGASFDRLLEATALLAARLHDAGLHHRDLYLCHFFARIEHASVSLALIDAARVRALPRLWARRWVIKDLAQFWYSTTTLAGVTDDQRRAWLDRYAKQRGIGFTESLAKSVARKVRWIARHDVSLRARQPDRNISIPQ